MLWYLNGQFIDKDQAFVPITDLGLNRGWGVFDYLRAYSDHGHKPFMVEDHLDRFFSHGKKIGLTAGLGKNDLKSVLAKLLEQDGLVGDIGVKILLTAGQSQDGVFPTGAGTLAVLLLPAGRYQESFYIQGIKISTASLPRLFPELKTTNYLTSMLALKEAKERGFDDALFCDSDGRILETTRSNFFFFQGGTLFTSDETDILPGVTRSVVLELAKPDFEVKVGSHQIERLGEADEAFITSTDKEIMPVVCVGDKTIGDAQVGPKTKFLREKFRGFVAEYYQNESRAKDVN